MNYFIGQYFMTDGTKPNETMLRIPIEWVPLCRDNEETLLISKYVIDWDAYAYEFVLNNAWNDSYLKEYLDKLYEVFFSEEEKDAIVEKAEGKLFVLSAEELCRYIPDPVERRAQMPFVKKNENCLEIFFEHYNYWLRNDSIDDEYGEVKSINSLGDIELICAEQDETGIRPCICVDTRKARWLTAKAGYNAWHHTWRIDEF